LIGSENGLKFLKSKLQKKLEKSQKS